MENNKNNLSVDDLARSIAIDAGAIILCNCTIENGATQGNLDSQILAYSIARDRVRTGAVSYDYPDLMQAIEKVVDEVGQNPANALFN